MADTLGHSDPTHSPDTKDKEFSLGKLLAIKLIVIALVAGGYLFFTSSWWNPKPNRDLAAEAQADLEKRKFKKLSGPLEALVTDPAYKPIPTQSHPLLGKKVPEFDLQDTAGKTWSISKELNQGPVVVVFYYGYHCSHCVSQLFGLTKDIEKFRELGVQVVAMSPDPGSLTLERYKKYGPFDFPVLSDPDNKVAEKFGCYVPSPKAGEDGDLSHGTFLVARDGTVLWANMGPEPFTENRTLLVNLFRAIAENTKKKSPT